MSNLPTLPVTFRPKRTRVVLLSAGVVILLVISAVAMLLEQLGPGERLSFILTGALIFWCWRSSPGYGSSPTTPASPS